MLGEALKPFPRDSYQLMSKVTTEDEGDPLKKLDELRRTSQTDYFDIMLLHWQHNGPPGPPTPRRWQDAILEAQTARRLDPRRLGARAARAAAGARAPSGSKSP
jgi:1-deoxyxylulose-5-phosphate synthase